MGLARNIAREDVQAQRLRGRDQLCAAGVILDRVLLLAIADLDLTKASRP